MGNTDREKCQTSFSVYFYVIVELWGRKIAVRSALLVGLCDDKDSFLSWRARKHLRQVSIAVRDGSSEVTGHWT